MPGNILRYAELVEEPSFAPGTVLAQQNTKSLYIDPSSLSLDAPNETDQKVESSFGRAASAKYAGFYNPSGSIAYQIDVRTVAAFFKWALGSYGFTAGIPPAPNVHEAWGSTLRDLPSFQSRLGKDNLEHLFQGCIIDTLTLSVEDATTSLEAETSAALDKDGGTMQSTTFVLGKLPTELKIPFTSVTATIDGVVQARKIKSLELSVSNNVDAEAGRYLGSRFPGRIPANEREVTISMDMDFSDKAQLEKFWGSATGPTNTGAIEFPILLDFYGGKNAGNADMSLQIQIPKAFYSTVETQPEGRDETVQSVEATCLTGSVTLDDGTTEVTTDIYAKVESMLAIVEAAVA